MCLESGEGGIRWVMGGGGLRGVGGEDGEMAWDYKMQKSTAGEREGGEWQQGGQPCGYVGDNAPRS